MLKRLKIIIDFPHQIIPVLLQSLCVKQPIATLLKKFVESWKIWMTVATAFAAAEMRVDAMSVRRCEPAPCCTGVQQLCDDD